MKQHIKYKTLSNGLRVLLNPLEFTQSFSIGFLVNVGTVLEEPSEMGFSHFVEHMMFKGTSKKNYFDISQAFEQLGAMFNAYTDRRYTFYYATVLHNKAVAVTNLLIEILGDSIFDQKEFDKEKMVILEEMAMYEDDPEDILYERFYRFAYPNHFLGNYILGTKQTIHNATQEQLKNFYNRYYTAANMMVSVAGKFEEQIILDKLHQASLKSGNAFPLKNEPIPLSTEINFENRELEQTHLAFGIETFALKDERRETLQLIASLLGGMASSRLFVKLREELGLCYGILSSANFDLSAGMLYIGSSTTPQKVNLFVEALLTQIRAPLRGEFFSELELEIVKNQFLTRMVLNEENPRNIMQKNIYQMYYYNEIFSLEEMIERFHRISLKHIYEVYEQIFIYNKSLSVYGIFPKQQSFSFSSLIV